MYRWRCRSLFVCFIYSIFSLLQLLPTLDQSSITLCSLQWLLRVVDSVSSPSKESLCSSLRQTIYVLRFVLFFHFNVKLLRTLKLFLCIFLYFSSLLFAPLLSVRAKIYSYECSKYFSFILVVVT